MLVEIVVRDTINDTFATHRTKENIPKERHQLLFHREEHVREVLSIDR